MPQTSKSYRSRIKPVVFTGFVFILLILGMYWVFTTQQSNALSGVFSKSRLTVKKMDVVAQLIEVVRSRARLTQKMIYTDDIFERNEITTKLNEKGGKFIQLRKELSAMGLSKQEQAVLEGQSEYISKAVGYIRQAADLAFTGEEADRFRAGKILITFVYPNQAGTVDHFMKLLKHLKSELDAMTLQASFSLEQHINSHLIMILIVAISALVTVLFIVRTIHRVESRLIQEKEKAQVTLRSIGDGVISVNRKGKVDYLNQVAVDIFSDPVELLSGQDIRELLGRKLIDEENQVDQFIKRMLQAGSYLTGSGDFRISLKNKPSVVMNAMISPIVDIEQKLSGLVISIHDVSKLESLLKKIQHMASHDGLTGLYNRGAFEQKVKYQIDHFSSQKGHVFCVIDLDQFKVVNDSVGHAAGDEMLRQLSGIMQPVFRGEDLFCRLGGDEFGVLLIDVSEQEAKTIAQDLLQAICGFGFSWEGNVYRVSASIGMVAVGSGLVDYNSLFLSADTACFTAKNEGRDQYHFLSIDANILLKKAQEVARLKYLTKSLEEGQNLVLYEQAIVPVSQRTEGRKHVEVLLRMKGAEDEIISPMAFLPIAERYGLMARIDRWVLQQVCDHILSTPSDSTVYAVNLSGESLSSKEVMKELVTIIFESRVPGKRLCIEVTETVAIANLEVAKRFMIVLQEYGCYTALDDFGTGLSSFSYLSKFPLDYLKIDGIFIRSMRKDKASRAMIEAIHYIGRKMGLMTIAEFVEDEESVQILKEIGVDMAQGYYFDKPHKLVSPQKNK